MSVRFKKHILLGNDKQFARERIFNFYRASPAGTID